MKLNHDFYVKQILRKTVDQRPLIKGFWVVLGHCYSNVQQQFSAGGTLPSGGMTFLIRMYDRYGSVCCQTWDK
jgi:hypothetical protein